MYKIYKIKSNNKNTNILATSLASIIPLITSLENITNIEINDIKGNLLLTFDKTQLDILNKQLKIISNRKCEEMKRMCPDGSKEFEPILMYEDWCDIPPKEYIKNNEYFNQCYRLSNLLRHFEAGLTQKKNNLNNPKYPFDPITRKKIPLEQLLKIYHQAEDANVDIPPVFTLFIKALYEGLIDINKAMAPEERNGHISAEYTDFINDFNSHVKENELTTEIDQETQELMQNYQFQY